MRIIYIIKNKEGKFYHFHADKDWLNGEFRWAEISTFDDYEANMLIEKFEEQGAYKLDVGVMR